MKGIIKITNERYLKKSRGGDKEDDDSKVEFEGIKIWTMNEM